MKQYNKEQINEIIDTLLSYCNWAKESFNKDDEYHKHIYEHCLFVISDISKRLNTIQEQENESKRNV